MTLNDIREKNDFYRRMEIVYCIVASRFQLKALDVFDINASEIVNVRRIVRRMTFQSRVVLALASRQAFKTAIDAWRLYESSIPLFEPDNEAMRYIFANIKTLSAHDIISPSTGRLRRSASEIAYVHGNIDPSVVKFDPRVDVSLYVVPFLALAVVVTRIVSRNKHRANEDPSAVMRHGVFLKVLSLVAMGGSIGVALALKKALSHWRRSKGIMKEVEDVAERVTEKLEEIPDTHEQPEMQTLEEIPNSHEQDSMLRRIANWVVQSLLVITVPVLFGLTSSL